MTNQLLLFDVDGVLIYPRGYKEALRAAIDHFAVEMGQTPFNLTDGEIATFEACGVTTEWDSVPMCVGAMLADALTLQPDCLRTRLGETLEALRQSSVRIERPDFAGLAREVYARTPEGTQPTRTIISLLSERIDEAAHPLLWEMLGENYTIRSPTTRVFQHYTLGSEGFSETYKEPAWFNYPGTLATHDRPLLAPDLRDSLLQRITSDGCGAAIFTARPSLPPADLPPEQFNSRGYSPEGDLAADLLGLAGHVPLIGAGRVAWLAHQHGKPASAYVKPSPVQALAAIGAAYSGQEAAALEAAAVLADEGYLIGPLADLAGNPLQVVVFEDSAGGIRAARLASDMLAGAGVSVRFEAVGITTEDEKQQALQRTADRITADINEALLPYLAG